MSESVKKCVFGAHAALAILEEAKGIASCFASPLMIVISAIRLIANLLFALLTTLGIMLCYLFCHHTLALRLQHKASLALQNAGYSLCHIFLSIFNLASFGYLGRKDDGSDFDIALESAFFGPAPNSLKRDKSKL